MTRRTAAIVLHGSASRWGSIAYNARCKNWLKAVDS